MLLNPVEMAIPSMPYLALTTSS